MDIISANNFLVAILTRFFAAVASNGDVDRGLKLRAEKFRANLSKKFSWEFDVDEHGDEGEDAPVVVDLGE